MFCQFFPTDSQKRKELIVHTSSQIRMKGMMDRVDIPGQTEAVPHVVLTTFWESRRVK